jgi:hypothetical protein
MGQQWQSSHKPEPEMNKYVPLIQLSLADNVRFLGVGRTIMKLASLAFVLPLLVFQPAVSQAAHCSVNFYRSTANEAYSLLPPLNRCKALSTRRPMNIGKLCRVCGPVISRTLAFDSKVRHNRSCFGENRKLKRAMAKFAAVRANLIFFKRGCGY